MTSRLIASAARLLLASVLTYLGLEKLLALWKGTLGTTLFSPAWLATVGALECGIALVLCLCNRRAAAWCALVLCVGLLVATASSMLTGLDLRRCGSFGTKTMSGGEHLAVALALVGMASAALIADHPDRAAVRSVR